MIEKAIELIKEEEGCRLTSYQDEGGVWTIGFGETEGVSEGMVITQDQADSFLSTKVTLLYEHVMKLIQVSLTDEQICAILSLVYNIGIGNFTASTLLKCLNAGETDQAADEFLKWHFVKKKPDQGLMNRRERERKIFLGLEVLA